MKRHLLFVLIWLSCAVGALAQGEISSERLLVTQVQIGAGYYIPMADMAVSHRAPVILSGELQFKNRKNWTLGIGGGYLFRDGIRNPEDYLLNMRTQNGNIIAQEGNFAEVIMNSRGIVINATIGKVFDIIGPNPNSGIVLRVGAGFMQHRIHIEARRDDVPQFEDDMRPYYDRMTAGFALNQFLGYQHLSNSRLTNFYIGLEAFQGFTRNQRAYNIDLGGPDNTLRNDMLVGIKAGWIVLIYKRKPQEFYYY